MIRASFLFKKNEYRGFLVSGHAGGKYGYDILCAGTSSAVMLAINIINDNFIKNKSDIKIHVGNNSAGIMLKKTNIEASFIIDALKSHLEYFEKSRNNISKCRIKVSIINA